MEQNTQTITPTTEQTTTKEPQKLNEIKADYVLNFCSQRGQADVDWLKSLYDTPLKDKEGNERELTFFDIRKEFAKKYYPHFMKDKNTLKDRIMKLKAVSTHDSKGFF